MKKCKSDKEANFDNEFCNVYVNNVTTRDCHAHISGEIVESDSYVELFKLLNRVEDEDQVTVHINTYGGAIHTTLEMMYAIQACKAKVITEISGTARSCGSMLFLSGHAYKIHSYSTMMCHYYSSFSFGKGNELKIEADFDHDYFTELFHRVYYGFLTKKEINELINGKDFYFKAPEIQTRLNIRHDLIHPQKLKKNLVNK